MPSAVYRMDTQPTTGISRVPCLPNVIHPMSYDTRLARETAGKLEVYVPLLRFILTKKRHGCRGRTGQQDDIDATFRRRFTEYASVLK
jgi:hypothetical protein